MRMSIPCLLLAAALWAGAAHAAPPKPAKQLPQPQQQAPKETEVQDSLESIVADCEKKKLPQEKEIECIEQGYRRFMGVPEPENP